MSLICHICESPTDFNCEHCGKPVCESCCVTPTYMNQIDYALCTDCDDTAQCSRAEAAEEEYKSEQAIKTAKAIKADARHKRYWLPENVAKRAIAKKERKRLEAEATRERLKQTFSIVNDMFK